jgi:hypothetical protein
LSMTKTSKSTCGDCWHSDARQGASRSARLRVGMMTEIMLLLALPKRIGVGTHFLYCI